MDNKHMSQGNCLLFQMYLKQDVPCTVVQKSPTHQRVPADATINVAQIL